MITQQLLNPRSIVVVGGSDDIQKPGGKVLKNLIDHKFGGFLYVANPKLDEVQGIKSYRDVTELPRVDLAILAIAAKFCPQTVEILAKQKETRAFIILSAGFHEESEEGARLEEQIVKTINETGGCLIGPNCIGVMNSNYAGVFTTPIPKLNPKGVDFISGSGATAVFIMEASMPKGLEFASVYSVGNSAQLGVEDVLEYLDNSFDPATSSHVKLLYVESINKPDKLLKHASSLISKGCKIAAIKSGGSEAGSRAASSHTGALASSDVAVEALFRKAGIVRCNGREELATVASIFMHPELTGKRIAIITHAGGPAVMLTDALSNNKLEIPSIEGPKAKALLEKLFPGSSVANPIDFLATGTAEQLGYIIDACENDFDNVDAMAVIFGSPGLFPVYDVYDLLDQKMKECKKPIYPILPSIINVKDEIEHFLAKERVNFPDEVVFGNALAKVYHTPKPQPAEPKLPEVDKAAIRNVIDGASNGYLSPENVQKLLDAAGITRAGEAVVASAEDAVSAAQKLGFPVVMKVVGPVHKSDVGGVVLNVKNAETVASEFNRMIKIKDTTAILIQPMLSGVELFVGAKREDKFGHMVLCGLGGIFIEVLKDVNAGLAPISTDEALSMIQRLKSYKILQGVRGQEPVNEQHFAEMVSRVSALVKVAPEIFEMDLNPLLGRKEKVVAVDARIRIEKE
ncbi:MAG TPA: acetate--CoA ligase family protein [Tenuifilaceae bacterium]|nr:acetate--CoA ligase family protein [Tenuifilaceae bacterium]HPE19031.1 acetate--CoA ligase family protein [Tenuifilaceae bacterium]HPJ46451.1 acetate--CoA ligase family protein [Tenuifilaceae bacterium]HPQ33932.1 acetate--CoA ligase family protein [Tenuifilaceae bacterium]